MPAELPIKELDSFLGRLVFGRSELRQRERQDFVAKFDDYMTATTVLASDLSNVGSSVSRSSLGRLFDRMATQYDRLTSERVDQVTSQVLFPTETQRQREMAEAVIRTQTRLGTIAPDSVRAQMQAVSALLIRWSENPGPSLTDEWLSRTKALRQAADAYLRPRWKRLLRLSRPRGQASP